MEGLNLYNPLKDNFRRFLFDSTKRESLSSNSINCIFKDQHQNGSYNILEDTNEKIWFDTQDGLGFYNGKTHNILTEKDGTITKDFIPILLDKSGNLWFSSNGMKLFKYDGNTFTKFSE